MKVIILFDLWNSNSNWLAKSQCLIYKNHLVKQPNELLRLKIKYNWLLKLNKTKLKLIFLCAFYTMILPWDMEQIIATSTYAFLTTLKANDKYIHSLGISIWLCNRICNQRMVYNLDSTYCFFHCIWNNSTFSYKLV